MFKFSTSRLKKCLRSKIFFVLLSFKAWKTHLCYCLQFIWRQYKLKQYKFVADVKAISITIRSLKRPNKDNGTHRTCGTKREEEFLTIVEWCENFLINYWKRIIMADTFYFYQKAINTIVTYDRYIIVSKVISNCVCVCNSFFRIFSINPNVFL